VGHEHPAAESHAHIFHNLRKARSSPNHLGANPGQPGNPRRNGHTGIDESRPTTAERISIDMHDRDLDDPATTSRDTPVGLDIHNRKTHVLERPLRPGDLPRPGPGDSPKPVVASRRPGLAAQKLGNEPIGQGRRPAAEP